MANLVQAHYLHSSEKTFFNYQRTVGDLDITGKNRFPSVIKGLTVDLNNALRLESQFYADFQVNNKEEWERKYLIGIEGERTSAQKVLALVNSPRMIDILSTPKRDKNYEKQQFLQHIQSLTNKIGKELVDYYSNIITNSSEVDIGKLLVEMGLFSKGKKFGHQLSSKTLQQAILKGRMKTLPKEKIKKHTDSQLKQFYNSFKKIDKKSDKANRKAQALTFFNKEIQNLGIPPAEQKVYSEVWNFILTKELMSDKDVRLFSDKSNVTGEVSEKGDVLAYVNFENPFVEINGETQINSMVQQMGRDLVARTGKSGVKSKADTVWIPPNGHKNGHKYYMQNKNSSQQIYNQFKFYNNLESLPNWFTYLPLQRQVKLSTLVEQLSNYKILSDDEKDLLIYLLSNYNVLTKMGAIAKGENKEGVSVAGKTQGYIDMILSKGIQYYISDLLPDESQIDLEKGAAFIIFMDKMLIPKSQIILNLINFIRDLEIQNSRIYTTSYLNGFSTTNYENMVKEKSRVIQEEEQYSDNIVFNYHNQLLVDIGSEYGNKAAEGLWIRNISFRFKIADLLNNNFR